MEIRSVSYPSWFDYFIFLKIIAKKKFILQILLRLRKQNGLLVFSYYKCKENTFIFFIKFYEILKLIMLKVNYFSHLKLQFKK